MFGGVHHPVLRTPSMFGGEKEILVLNDLPISLLIGGKGGSA
jgi:hypothetical protein